MTTSLYKPIIVLKYKQQIMKTNLEYQLIECTYTYSINLVRLDL